ncbi:MAG: flagellar biosynthesis protein FlhF [Magnetococcales bacterium]|nr:flagellar biosynthesis protein FlhF [Magnetococcales bacterium]
MKISTFRARDMREALLAVKEELGADAVILSTRSIREKGGGGLGDTVIEVTACPSPASNGEKSPAGGAGGVTNKEKPAKPRLSPAARFSALAEGGKDRAAESDKKESPTLTALRKIREEQSRSKDSVSAPVAPPPPRSVQSHQAQSPDLSKIQSSLKELEERVSDMPGGMVGGIPMGDVAGLDQDGRRYYGWLLMHGVEEPIARKIVMTDRSQIAPGSESGLEAALKSSLQFHDPLSGKARVICLVGPTGVGKTTTLAKIAADLMLNRQRSVGMITLDTFRVGAVAQLETYAKLLQVRLVVARTLSEVKAGLHALNRCDYVLVDTVGSSPYNRRQVNSTAGLLPIMGDDREVILCMSANVRETEQQAIHRRFSVLNPTGLIFTKLDETVTYGGILNVAIKSGLPLTMYTDGQRVPENLGWMSSKTLASWFKKDTTAAFADDE